MAFNMRSIIGRNQPKPKIDWYNPEKARAGMDTPLKRAAGSLNYYGSYSDGALQPTATDRGNVVRPNMPPLRDTLVSRAVNKLTWGDDGPVKAMGKPSRADRKQYKKNLNIYEATQAQAKVAGGYDYKHPDAEPW